MPAGGAQWSCCEPGVTGGSPALRRVPPLLRRVPVLCIVPLLRKVPRVLTVRGRPKTPPPPSSECGGSAADCPLPPELCTFANSSFSTCSRSSQLRSATVGPWNMLPSAPGDSDRDVRVDAPPSVPIVPAVPGGGNAPAARLEAPPNVPAVPGGGRKVPRLDGTVGAVPGAAGSSGTPDNPGRSISDRTAWRLDRRKTCDRKVLCVFKHLPLC